MALKTASLLAFGIAVLGLVYLIEQNHIFSKNPITIVIQICSFSFMIWARITFGLRSFHATANTTKGALVTTGPYRILRHPIYAAVIYFSWACVIAYPFLDTICAVVVISGGLFVRMLLEEKSLLVTYDNYAEYSRHTKRIIPYLF
jgi:protein-S-isoprenylcysteine O-methyltransferase Ste14